MRKSLRSNAKRKLWILVAAAIMLLAGGTSCFMAGGKKIQTAKAAADTVESGLDYRETTDEIVNPERGFYKALSARLKESASGAFWTTAYLKSLSAQYGILHLRFGLEEYSSNAALSMTSSNTVASYGADGSIGASALGSLRATLENVRLAGGTAIVRFSYNVNGYQENTANGMRYVQAEPNGGMDMIEQHIAQLGGVLKEFGDVVAAVETGMFGPWGEQHSTALAAEGNRENYYRLGEAWLKAAPSGRSISFRRPLYFMHWASQRYGLTLTEETLGERAKELAEIGGDVLRVGCYNDGYLGSSSDLGTFGADNRSSVSQWLHTQAQTTFYGGEVVADASGSVIGAYNSVENIAGEGFVTHTSYLNIDWNNNVIAAWKNTPYHGNDTVYAGQSGYTYIANRLGYRLVQRASALSAGTKQGDILHVTGRIENVGFGNVINEKKATALLVHDGNGMRYTAEVDFDVRTIGSGESVEYDWQFRIPSGAPAGRYTVYLRFADALEQDPAARGIRFANVGNVYDYGANLLGTVEIAVNEQAGEYPLFEQIGKTPSEPDVPETPKATVTYAGGAEATGTAGAFEVSEGTTVVLSENPFTRPHYRFIGWSDGLQVYQAGDEYIVSGDVTFTAQWEIESYRVMFYGGGGTLVRGNEEQTVAYGEAAIAPEYEREGYTFLGWDKAFDSITSETTVKAQWKIKSYLVRFDGNGGLLASGSAEQRVNHGEAAIAPEYEREGYTFLGWDKAFDSVTSEITVTAQWKIKSYLVRFDGNGGLLASGSAEQRVNHGEAAIAPEYEREGYIFLGWDKAFDSITSEITVTAQWEKRPAPPSPPAEESGGCNGAIGVASAGGMAVIGLGALAVLLRKKKQ